MKQLTLRILGYALLYIGALMADCAIFMPLSTPVVRLVDAFGLTALYTWLMVGGVVVFAIGVSLTSDHS